MRHPGERLRQQAQRLDDLDMRLRRRPSSRQMHLQQQELARLAARLGSQHPERQLALLGERLQNLGDRLPRAMQAELSRCRQVFAASVHGLQLVSPLATLGSRLQHPARSARASHSQRRTDPTRATAERPSGRG